MKLSLRLVTSNQDTESRLLQSLIKLVNPRLNAIVPKIQETARNLLRVSLQTSPEYLDLLGGRLQTELGVVDPSSALLALTERLVQSVSVVSKGATIKNKQISAVIRLTASPSNFSEDVKHLGVYTTRKGSKIPWLDWLLNYGDQIIVRDYDVDFSAPAFSRTGGAIMSGAGSIFGNTTANSDGGWRVPPEFSGTADNNFITRSVDQIAPQLEQFMLQNFKNI